MKYVLDYIYYGEIQIHQENLDRFLRIAQRLQIEGLTTEEEPSQVNKLDFEVEENDIRFMSRKEMKVWSFIINFLNDYVMVYDLGYH